MTKEMISGILESVQRGLKEELSAGDFQLALDRIGLDADGQDAVWVFFLIKDSDALGEELSMRVQRARELLRVAFTRAGEPSLWPFVRVRTVAEHRAITEGTYQQ